MPVPISAAAAALLAKPVHRPRAIVELFSEYLNSDLRASVDITDDVVKFSRLTGASSLKRIDWELPSFTVSVRNLNAKFNRGDPASVWTTLGKEPRECVLKFQYVVDLPGGGYEVLQTYHGSIKDAVHRESEDMGIVDLVTVHMADEYLDVSITKQSGDETTIVNGVY